MSQKNIFMNDIKNLIFKHYSDIHFITSKNKSLVIFSFIPYNKHSQRHGKLLLPAPAKSIYENFCRAEGSRSLLFVTRRII